ncbi:pyridoxal phosphate-dependent aminotransferase [Phascolarctobacterium sp.]|uniref:pyridoxal phosphate-dependent aminotransferase n=1 Tax=Phascolarctobacterium sp. TaxID=2049039 RepID=UPI00386ADFB8
MADFSVRKSIERMEEYSVETVAAGIIVNANESNYPMPEEIAKSIAARTARFPFNRYPPMKSENLAQVIADELEVDIDCVKIGNGSSELLEKACYVFGGPGKKIAVPWPSFSMYGEYADLSDSEAVRYPLTEEGYVDADSVIAFCKEQQPALLIVCNPNNPTGNYNPLAVMEKIIANVDCPVIMDEAYMEFADGKDVPPNDMRPLNKLWLVAGSTLSLLGKYSNFMVFRTFSKAYGLAGMRCGYAVGALGLVRQLGKAILPYSVNAFTLMVAKTLYENKLLYKQQVKTIREERDKMAAYMANLGFRVWPTATNFVMLRAEGALMEQLAAAYAAKYGDDLPKQAASGKLIFKYYLENSILVRDFTSHPVLTGALRITVGTPEENKQILSKLTELVVATGGKL